MVFNRSIPLVECNLKEQIESGLVQSKSGLFAYKAPLDNLIELVAITKPHIGSYLIVEHTTLQADCVLDINGVWEYVSKYQWDMLWWGAVTQELMDFCVEKYNES